MFIRFSTRLCAVSILSFLCAAPAIASYNVELSDGKTKQLGDVVLEPGATLRGVVESTSGDRLAGAQVIAKTGLVIAVLALIVQSAPLVPGPLLIGILVLPVVLVIEMVRSTSPAALAASTRGTDR